MSETEEQMKAGQLSHYLERVEEDAGVQQAKSQGLKPLQKLRRWMAGLLFVLPVCTSLLYNFVIATPRFASDLSFVVRTTDASQSRYSVLNLTKAEGADDSEAIIAYVRSRELLSAIDRDGFVRKAFAQPGIDSFSAFPSLISGHSQEDFYKHFKKFVNADFDRGTNITSVEVQAFAAADAREIARRILAESEGMVNRLNARARAGLVLSAEQDMEQASADLNDVLSRLDGLRNTRRMIEPKLEAGAAIKLSSATESQLATANVDLRQTMAAAPDSPLIGQLRTRRSAIETEIVRQDGKVIGGPAALASRMRDMERANAEREISEKRLLAANIGLMSARSSADRQQLYVERIANPNLPDEPLYPRMWRNLLYTILVSAGLLWIAFSLAELVFADD